MTRKTICSTAVSLMYACLIVGCGGNAENKKAEAPPPATVIHEDGFSLVHVDHPERFPLTAVVEHQATSTLNVTGTVNPDISQEIPVVTLASGRVLDIRVRLGDYVHKGELLMDVQSNDVSGAFGQYLKAVNDERLANTQLERSKLLYDKGAIARAQLEIAQDGEADAKADLTAALEQLRVLGVDKNHPSAAVKIYAPASGFIVTQNVTNAAAAGVTYAGSSSAFTIADLSHVWIICDVYENDLPSVHVGQTADIRLAAYPNKVLTGRISEIDAMLDPNLRTAKVRIQVNNPDMLMRIGMFATATFHGKKLEMHAAVPASAVLHLEDRDWVYEPAGGGEFRKVGVTAGDMLPNSMQEIVSGVNPGQQVVSNALELRQTATQ